ARGHLALALVDATLPVQRPVLRHAAAARAAHDQRLDAIVVHHRDDAELLRRTRLAGPEGLLRLHTAAAAGGREEHEEKRLHHVHVGAQSSASPRVFALATHWASSAAASAVQSSIRWSRSSPKLAPTRSGRLKTCRERQVSFCIL